MIILYNMSIFHHVVSIPEALRKTEPFLYTICDRYNALHSEALLLKIPYTDELGVQHTSEYTIKATSKNQWDAQRITALYAEIRRLATIELNRVYAAVLGPDFKA